MDKQGGNLEMIMHRLYVCIYININTQYIPIDTYILVQYPVETYLLGVLLLQLVAATDVKITLWQFNMSMQNPSGSGGTPCQIVNFSMAMFNYERIRPKKQEHQEHIPTSKLIKKAVSTGTTTATLYKTVLNTMKLWEINFSRHTMSIMHKITMEQPPQWEDPHRTLGPRHRIGQSFPPDRPLTCAAVDEGESYFAQAWSSIRCGTCRIYIYMYIHTYMYI